MYQKATLTYNSKSSPSPGHSHSLNPGPRPNPSPSITLSSMSKETDRIVTKEAMVNILSKKLNHTREETDN
jgi:hypothetical protein